MGTFVSGCTSFDWSEKLVAGLIDCLEDEWRLWDICIPEEDNIFC
ncbi:hypothetical protein SLEP1_g25098 [Rubroshorea leprosula]|uniref:Uncharacterized protein n=1 Tax=Rubroshorea leprosula TaxID=152421 RepID=A0AAV5JQ12_9ROSI|nr:hypothetical protein SLEP1_g25098 [Rubroshorea leprosula]